MNIVTYIRRSLSARLSFWVVSCVMLLFVIPLIALAIGMLYTLKSRIKEIRSGEEDDLDNY